MPNTPDPTPAESDAAFYQAHKDDEDEWGESTPESPRYCARCDKSKWWHRLPEHAGNIVRCHDGTASPTFNAESMRPVYEALEHLERLDLPSPYEELTLFPAESLESPLAAASRAVSEAQDDAELAKAEAVPWHRIEQGQQ